MRFADRRSKDLPVNEETTAEARAAELDRHILDEFTFRNDLPQYYKEEDRTYEAIVAYVMAERAKGVASMASAAALEGTAERHAGSAIEE